MDIYNLVSLIGFLVILLISWIFSEHRIKISNKTVLVGVIAQIIIAIFIFIFPFGSRTFLFFSDLFLKVLESASAGAEFLFGRLSLSPGSSNIYGEQSIGFILAFQVFPIIIFFSSLVSILYYYKILPRFIKFLSKLFTKFMSISGAESLVATSNIFVGIESALTVKPYLNSMTRSELCTILTVGMATVSSSVLGIYVLTLEDVFPTIAAHLMSASLLSAPAAVVISKILVPETSTPKTLGVNVEAHYERESNVVESIINGAENGMKLVVAIAALLIAFLGIVKLVDIIFIFLGGNVNTFLSIQFDWSLRSLLGYIFYPLTLLIGIPIEDAYKISGVIGERLVVTEVVSYQSLSHLVNDGAIQNRRSVFVASYALCGFAHFASMAIFVGGISALAPDKKSEIAKLGIKSLFAATLTCLLTACVAGIFYNSKNILF